MPPASRLLKKCPAASVAYSRSAYFASSGKIQFWSQSSNWLP